MRDSKTQRAIARVDAGENPHAAAKAEGLSANTLYVALKRRRERSQRVECPRCGSMVAPEQIKTEVSTMSDLELKIARVLKQLDYTAEHSEGPEKRAICVSIARLLRE